jgi:PQQ-dependent dehydrogenase (methanol/ethanol family)
MRLYFVFLLLAGVPAAWAQDAPDSAKNPFAANAAATAAAAVAGRHVFNSTCTPCHGGAGVGTERAPALDSGQFKHGSEDFEIFQTIQKGVPGTPMPSFSSFSAEQLWQLVTYVRSLSQSGAGGGSIPPNADASRGEKLFFGPGRCSTCHEVNGRGSWLAADLSEVGKQTPARIKTGMQHLPDFGRMFSGPNQRYVDVTLRDGTKLEALVKNEDSLSVVLQTLDGGYRLLDRRQIRELTNSSRALGPADLAKRFSADQLGDLLAYLAQQKQRAPTPIDVPSTGLSFTRLKEAGKEPQNWLTYWGSYRSEHFSELTQINRSNVATLQARWAAPLPGDVPLESTPLVVDGVMYLAGAPGEVYAFDARSGLLIWRFHRQQQTVNPFQINPFNRGVAVMGQRVFVVTLDNQLITLDARSGRVLWEKQLANTMEGYTMTGAPLVLDNTVIVGISGGEMGIRGFLDAYDVRDGHQLWRFYTVPGPGEPGHESWSGDSWKTGSGATWLTGSYDSQLNLLYWAVGNPGPDFDPEKRKGDNLYTDSVLAMNPDSGKVVWYYQFTPNDTHDWDCNEDLILAEIPVAGQMRKVLLHADRNGFLYTLDRVTGKFISGVPFVRQTWNKGFDANGKPIVNPESVATPQGHSIAPGVGGTNFQAPSYDPKRRVLFLNYLDAESTATYQPVEYQSGQVYTGANWSKFRMPARPPEHGVMALDVLTGRKLWTFPVTRLTLPAGVLATRGDVVFAATAEGNLLGLDALNGQPLWHFQTNRPILASPMSYSVDGAQFVAVSAGNTLYVFALPEGRR